MAFVNLASSRITYADLERWPDDGRRYELYDGEVSVVPAPLPRHQVVQQNLSLVLHEYARRTGGFSVASPIDIVFTEHNVVQPDLVFFKAERHHLVDLDRVIRNAPDLCVEVLSPSTEDNDRGRRMQMFARFGVPDYWIVDPLLRSVEVHRLDGDSYVLTLVASDGETVTSPALAGLAFDAATIFP